VAPREPLTPTAIPAPDHAEEWQFHKEFRDRSPLAPIAPGNGEELVGGITFDVPRVTGAKINLHLAGDRLAESIAQRLGNLIGRGLRTNLFFKLPARISK
jgi:hypothetical protein